MFSLKFLLCPRLLAVFSILSAISTVLKNTRIGGQESEAFMGCFPSLNISTIPMLAIVAFVRFSELSRCCFRFSSVTTSLMLRIFMLRLALLIALLCCSLNEQSPFAVFPLSRVIILFSKSPIFSIVSALLLLDSFPIVVVASRTCFIRFRNSVFVSCCSVAIDSSLSSRCSMLLVSPTPGVSPFLSFFRLALSSGVGIWLVVFLFVPLSLFSILLTIFSTLGGDGFGILQFLALGHLLPLF